MAGVEIINQIEIMKSPWYYEVIIIVFMTLSLFLILIAYLFRKEYKNYGNKKDRKESRFYYLLSFLLFIIGIIGGLLTHNTKFVRYEYEVMIDNNVSLNEFHEKFEIIERIDDNIYKVILLEEGD